jgi:acetylornithine deacetylase/succinyl-diaminopimelate desuccinylase-like protein
VSGSAYSSKVLTADLADAVVVLTWQLVGFDSVNPGLVQGAVGEGPIAQFVADGLSGSGVEVQLVPVPSDPRRMTVIAVRDGGQPGRTVVLNGHLHTVGVDEWIDLAQLRRYPMAVAGAAGRFLAG